MAKNTKPAAGYAGRYTEGLKSTRPLENDLNTYDVSIGNIDKSQSQEAVKTGGIKIRGTGAATKGVMARGPMA